MLQVLEQFQSIVYSVSLQLELCKIHTHVRPTLVCVWFCVSALFVINLMLLEWQGVGRRRSARTHNCKRAHYYQAFSPRNTLTMPLLEPLELAGSLSFLCHAEPHIIKPEEDGTLALMPKETGRCDTRTHTQSQSRCKLCTTNLYLRRRPNRPGDSLRIWQKRNNYVELRENVPDY